jgi:hypothetical protein
MHPVYRKWLIVGGVGIASVAALVAATFPQTDAAPVEPTAADAAVVDTSARDDTAAGHGGGDVPQDVAPGDVEPRDAAPAVAGPVEEPADEAETVVVREGVLRVRLPQGLGSSLPDDIGALPGVLAVTVSRSDTVGLLGSRTADGTPRDELRDGFRIPVGVSAIDPSATAATLALEGADPELLDVVAGLEPGQALLTASSAEVRGLDIGGRLDLDGVVDLVVVGVVPDDAAGRTEIMVHREHAEPLGMRPGRSLTVRHEVSSGAPTGELIAAIEVLAPDPDDVRITDVAAEAIEREEADREASPARAPLVLGLPELKATFGEFAYRPRSGVREIDIDPAFVDANMVTRRVPLLGNVTCHRAIIDDVAAALDELVEAGLGSWVNPAQYGGCFHARRIGTDRDRLSSHSWGAAIDINVDLSLPGLGPVPPDEMITIFGRNGFRWGGDFTTPDNHHWEWVGERATERRDR